MFVGSGRNHVTFVAETFSDSNYVFAGDYILYHVIFSLHI